MIKTTMNAVMKQPLILIIICAIMLVLEVFNIFIPVMAMVVGVINVTGSDLFSGLFAIMQLLIDPQNILIILISVTVLALLLSTVVGLLLPGYLLSVNDSLAKGARKKGLFVRGIKKHFFRTFLITIRVTYYTAVLAVFMLVSSVPAVAITRFAISTKPDLMIAAVFIDILTVGVFWIGLSFYSIYIYMWYIASLTATKTPFRAGKVAADRRFWRIAAGLLVFDLLFAAGLNMVYMINNQAMRYILGWVFTSSFFTTLAVYLVNTFRDSSQIPIDKTQD